MSAGLGVGVLVSGEGSNLQAILDTAHGRDGIEVVCVASNRADARALERAHAAGVTTGVFAAGDHPDRAARDVALGEFLERHGARLVVLAGFMEILTPGFVQRFDGRILNVHPSLLPAFAGLRPIERAVESGVRVTGVTVHFVDEGVDSGPILLQEAIELPYPAAIAEVEQRIHAVEHRLLPEAIAMIARGEARLEEREGRRVVALGEAPRVRG